MSRSISQLEDSKLRIFHRIFTEFRSQGVLKPIARRRYALFAAILNDGILIVSTSLSLTILSLSGCSMNEGAKDVRSSLLDTGEGLTKQHSEFKSNSVLEARGECVSALNRADLPSVDQSSGSYQTEPLEAWLVASRGTQGDSRLLAVQSDGRAVVYRTGLSEAPRQLIPARGRTHAAAWSPQRGILAMSTDEGVAIELCDSQAQQLRLNRLKVKATALKFNHTGTALLIGGADGRVYRWKFDLERRATTATDRERSLEQYIGHSSVIGAVGFHPAGRVFFSADWKGRFNAWLAYDADVYGGEFDKSYVPGQVLLEKSTRVRAQGDLNSSVDHLEVSEDGSLIVTGTDEGKLSLWLVRGFKKVAEKDAHSGLIYDVELSSDGRRILTVGRDGAVRLWKVVFIEQHAGDPTKVELELTQEFPAEEARQCNFNLSLNRIDCLMRSGELIHHLVNAY